jgi:hypothetical protein
VNPEQLLEHDLAQEDTTQGPIKVPPAVQQIGTGIAGDPTEEADAGVDAETYPGGGRSAYRPPPGPGQQPLDYTHTRPGYADPAYAPQGYGAAAQAQRGYPQENLGASGYTQPGYRPASYPPQGYGAPDAYPPPGGYGEAYPPASYDPQGHYPPGPPGYPHYAQPAGAPYVPSGAGPSAASAPEGGEDIAEVDDVELIDEDTSQHGEP